MGKKTKAVAKKKAEPKEAVEPAAEPAEATGWKCDSCGYEGNEDADEECAACGAPRPAPASADGGGDERYKGYKVGLVLEAEKVAGKDKLLQLKVDVGGGEPLPIVTNAGNVKEGVRVIVATVGAMISIKGEEEEVKKANVGGCPSEGMLCDGPMLGWTGGGSGAAALVPESFEVGATPPSSRPRMDGK
mmetsp:Transcript_151396/g.267222  ORF Transcript_151396/g.267222 Transcript_151396/m.267222 type:complete len:189 (+) Transcript_151396:59-625(+)